MGSVDVSTRSLHYIRTFNFKAVLAAQAYIAIIVAAEAPHVATSLFIIQSIEPNLRQRAGS